MLEIFKKKPFTPSDLADQAYRILSGKCRQWDVDCYENYRSKDQRLQDLHAESLSFGLPEEWTKLNDVQKGRLQAIIEQMRQVKADS